MRIVAKHLTGARRGETDSFTTAPLTIGRVPSSDLRLGINDTRASGRHAEIRLENQRVVLRDVGSTNGTFVNGQRIQQAFLQSGDVLEFGTGGPKLQVEITGLTPLVAADLAPAQALPHKKVTYETKARVAPGPQVAAPPAAPLQPPIIEEREFVIKSQFKYYLIIPGLMILIGGIALFGFDHFLIAMPATLLGLVMLLLGLAISRKNITLTRRSVRQEGLFSSHSINWDEIESLSSQRSRTQVLTHQIYIIQGRRDRIIFTPSGYLNGGELLELIARRSNRNWS